MRFKPLLILLFLSTSCVWAQTVTNSPYTRYALGDINSIGSGAGFGMGGFGVAYAPVGQINLQNPANFAMLVRHKPVFDMGLQYKYLNLETASANDQLLSVSMQNLAFAFPAGKRAGFGFGLQPYSSIGYKMVDYQTIPEITEGDVEYQYDGEGGINRIYLGGAYRILSTENATVSVGVTGSYLFGTITHFARTIFPFGSGYYNTRVEKSVLVNDFKYDVGFYYQGKVNDKMWLHVGAVYNSNTNLNARKSLYSANYVETGPFSEYDVDTLQFMDSVSGHLSLPMGLNYGFALDIRPGGDMDSRWLIGVDYKLQDWSKYKEVFEGEEKTDLLKNSYQISVGVQYTPTMVNESNCGMGLFKRVNYRVGFRYNSTQLQLNESDLTETGISFGVGIPISSCNTPTMINIGAEFGERGTIENNLIREQFATVYLGLSLSPWRSDKWFVKQEYD